jgi:hypothetical protein
MEASAESPFLVPKLAMGGITSQFDPIQLAWMVKQAESQMALYDSGAH